MRQQTEPPRSSPTSAAGPQWSAPPQRARGHRFRLRTTLAVLAGRCIGASVRRLGLGGGTSLPGVVARAVDPQLTRTLSDQLTQGSVLVTGTNGKTTTSGLLAAVLRSAGHTVWRNREGANLARGVTSVLLRHARPSGALHEHGQAVGLFEVDEASLPTVALEVQPRVLVIGNLFRDQLDRYGEVDSVAERWRAALRALPPTTTLVLNADDPAVAHLAHGRPVASVLYFGLETTPGAMDEHERPQVLDTRTCPACRAPLEFAPRFYSHIGHWRCLGCGAHRPTPHVSAARVVVASLEGTSMHLSTPTGCAQVRLALPGLYNVYNALAAAAAGVALGVDVAQIAHGLAGFAPAFGRGERIAVGGRTVHLLLAKNPTGLNEVLRALARQGTDLHLLLLLNDAPADGTDVSWIWDADVEQVAGVAARVTAGGSRAYDLALRLKYAGVATVAAEPEIATALDAALAAVPEGQTLYVVPTYTAMLAVRAVLERQGHATRYWGQTDA